MNKVEDPNGDYHHGPIKPDKVLLMRNKVSRPTLHKLYSAVYAPQIDA